jgi:hypothetical protein
LKNSRGTLAAGGTLDAGNSSAGVGITFDCDIIGTGGSTNIDNLVATQVKVVAFNDYSIRHPVKITGVELLIIFFNYDEASTTNGSCGAITATRATSTTSSTYSVGVGRSRAGNLKL